MIILERDGSLHNQDKRRRRSDDVQTNDDHAEMSDTSDSPNLFRRLLGLTVSLFRHDDVEEYTEE